jgi:hypothetical protein
VGHDPLEGREQDGPLRRGEVSEGLGIVLVGQGGEPRHEAAPGGPQGEELRTPIADVAASRSVARARIQSRRSRFIRCGAAGTT